MFDKYWVTSLFIFNFDYKEKRSMAEVIKQGDTICVNYTGKFENGEVFDTLKAGSRLNLLLVQDN